MSCYSLLFHSASQHFDAFSGLFTKVFTFENFVRVNFLLIISNSYFLNSEDRGIPDESDRFMMDPFGFASDYAKNWSVPSHIVLFDSEEKLLREFLISHSFKQVHLIFPFFFFPSLFPFPCHICLLRWIMMTGEKIFPYSLQGGPWSSSISCRVFFDGPVIFCSVLFLIIISDFIFFLNFFIRVLNNCRSYLLFRNNFGIYF